MELLTLLLVILVVTRVFGEVAVRLHQPALVGELIAGVVLGYFVHRLAPSMPELADMEKDKVFVALSDLGVFFLMLLGGLEMKHGQLARATGSGIWIAVSGMLLPLAAGIGLGLIVVPASDYRPAQVLFLGTALAITAVPVAVKVLMDLGRLETPAGRIIVAAAIFDDILSLILLAVLTTLIKTGEWPGPAGIALILGRIILFFAITVGISLYLLPWMGKRLHRARLDEFEFSILLIVALSFGVLAEALHIHFILGAFAAGLFFTRRTVARPETFDRVQEQIRGLTSGFLAPVFFASIGMHLDTTAFREVPVFLAVLVLIAFFSKLIGAGLPARLIGYTSRESVVIGVGMSARGAVELIIADVALKAGLFSHPDPTPPIISNLFSAIVIMAVLTTLITPVFLRALLPDAPPNRGQHPSSPD